MIVIALWVSLVLAALLVITGYAVRLVLDDGPGQRVAPRMTGKHEVRPTRDAVVARAQVAGEPPAEFLAVPCYPPADTMPLRYPGARDWAQDSGMHPALIDHPAIPSLLPIGHRPRDY